MIAVLIFAAFFSTIDATIAQRNEVVTGIATKGDSSCISALSIMEAEKISKNISAIHQRFITGRITEEQRNEQTGLLIKSISSFSSKDAAVRLSVLENTQQLSNQIAMAALFRYQASGRVPSHDRELLQKIGVPEGDVDNYIKDLSERFNPYLQELSSRGAKIGQTGVDFESLAISAADLDDKSATLKTAISLFGSPQLLEDLANPQRTQAVSFNKTVFLPPGWRMTPPFDRKALKLKTMTTDNYSRLVGNLLQQVREDLKTYLLASKRAGTYSSLVQGKIWERWTGKTYSSGNTVERDEAAARISNAFKEISWLGLPPDQLQKLNTQIQEAFYAGREDIDKGVAKIDNAILALKAAPFVLLPAAASVTGVAGGTGVLASAAATSTYAKMLGTSILFSYVPAVLNAGNHALTKRGNPASSACRFVESLQEGGASALWQAPLFAGIPALGYGVKALAGARVAAGMNLGIALGFLGTQGASIAQQTIDCKAKLTEANELLSRKDLSDTEQNAADEIAEHGRRACLQAGVDLSFARVGATQIRKVAKLVNLTQRKMAEQSLGRKINDTEALAIDKAHLVGVGRPGRIQGSTAGVGNYTPEQLRDKAKILKEAGFSEAERRKLMEDEVVGVGAEYYHARRSQPAPPTERLFRPKVGETVRARFNNMGFSNAKVLRTVGDLQMEVEFVDGTRKVLFKSQLQPPFENDISSLGKEETVWVLRSDKKTLDKVKILEFREDGEVVVIHEKYTRSSHVSELFPNYKLGDEVAIPRSDGGYSNGKVLRVHSDGWVEVAFMTEKGPATKAVRVSDLRKSNAEQSKRDAEFQARAVDPVERERHIRVATERAEQEYRLRPESLDRWKTLPKEQRVNSAYSRLGLNPQKHFFEVINGRSVPLDQAAIEKKISKAFQKLSLKTHPDRLRARLIEAQTPQEIENSARSVSIATEEFKTIGAMKDFLLTEIRKSPK